MKDQLPYVGGIRFTPAAASPLATGQPGVYVKSADGVLYFRKADGTETAWGAGGGGGSSFYQSIKNAAGTAQTQRAAEKFTGEFTLTDDGTNTVVSLTDVVTAGTSGGGTVFINSVAYNSKGQITAVTTGTPAGGGGLDTTAPYTFTGVHTHAANITFDNDTRNIGDATHRAANLYALTVQSGASQLLIKSSIAAGATPAVVFDTANTFSNKVYDFRNNGSSIIDLNSTGGGTNYLEFNVGGNVGYFVWSSTGLSFFNNTGVWSPATNNTQIWGSSSSKIKQLWGYQYCGVVQTVAVTTAALTIDPTAGETVRLTMTGSPATVAFNAGQPGQVLRVEWIQDATGGRNLPSSANVTGAKLTSYGLTTTANTRTIITLIWDSVDNLWYEIARVSGLA